MDQNSGQPVTKEIRFAVVMYGGVSLAVYMNGIAQELLHLVRSTARKGWEEDESEFRFTEMELTGTERVYRRLAQKLTPGGKQNGVRFIVDILSGTSAGGINGIFLAKALANGQNMDSLQQLWIQEGDLGKLLNDSKSTLGVELPRPSKPKSLLNSDRMYLELLGAFTDMDFPKSESPGPRQELVEELDLYVTTTDIRGQVVPLRTSDRLVYERRYKYAFHLQYARAEGKDTEAKNDFTLENNPFLAFIGRCTSSFPFAFEPMRLAKVEELVPRFTRHRYDASLDQWSKFFRNFKETGKQGEIKERAFGDGGYLDNKPFGHAIDALRKRSSDVPSERKLIYIEPAPEHPELETAKSAQSERQAPNAIENSLAALVTLPGYEPIREDLLRINERNRVIRKINELIDRVMEGLQSVRRPEPPEGKRPDESVGWQQQRGAFSANYFLLRAFDVTDTLANVIGRALNIERESSYFYALRSIVRVWREMFYQRSEKKMPIPEGTKDAPEGTTLDDFLRDFDLDYYLRRARFVTTQVDLLYSLDVRAVERLTRMGVVPPQWSPNDEEKEEFLAGLREIKKAVGNGFRKLRSAAQDMRKDLGLRIRLGALGRQLLQGPTTLLDRVLGVTAPTDKQRGVFAPRLQNIGKDYVQNARKILSDATNPADTALLISNLNQFGLVIGHRVQSAISDADSLSGFRETKAVGGRQLAYDAVLRFYDEFLEYDASIFPVIYGTDVGELDWVDIIRISPEDAPTIVDELRDNVRKLKGAWLAHFGAFLDGRWRASDILWGRLDAAERLIRSLVENKKDADMLVEAAHDSILEDLVDESLSISVEDILAKAIAVAAGQSGGSES